MMNDVILTSTKQQQEFDRTKRECHETMFELCIFAFMVKHFLLLSMHT
jgi:hypothetical protein